MTTGVEGRLCRNMIQPAEKSVEYYESINTVSYAMENKVPFLHLSYLCNILNS